MNISLFFLTVTIVLLVTVLGFRYLWTTGKKKARKICINFLVFIFASCYLFLIAEYVFSSFLIFSDGLNSRIQVRSATASDGLV